MYKALFKAGTVGIAGGIILFPLVALDAVVRDQLGGAESLLAGGVLASTVTLWIAVGFLAARLSGASKVWNGMAAGAFAGAIAWLLTASFGVLADGMLWQIREPAVALTPVLVWMTTPVINLLRGLGLDGGILGFSIWNFLLGFMGTLLGVILGSAGGFLGRVRPKQQATV